MFFHTDIVKKELPLKMQEADQEALLSYVDFNEGKECSRKPSKCRSKYVLSWQKKKSNFIVPHSTEGK